MAQFGGGGNKNPPWAPRGNQGGGDVPPGLVGFVPGQGQAVFQPGNPGIPPGLAGVGPLGVQGPPGGHGPAVTLAAMPVSSRASLSVTQFKSYIWRPAEGRNDQKTAPSSGNRSIGRVEPFLSQFAIAIPLPERGRGRQQNLVFKRYFFKFLTVQTLTVVEKTRAGDWRLQNQRFGGR